MPASATLADERELTTVHPSMVRTAPVMFVVEVLLCFVIVGIPLLLLRWLKVHGTTLTVTNRRTILRRGILSKSTTEVLHSHVRNIQIEQTFMQRMLGVGSIGISSAGQAGVEIAVDGVPSPEQIKKLIDGNR